MIRAQQGSTRNEVFRVLVGGILLIGTAFLFVWAEFLQVKRFQDLSWARSAIQTIVAHEEHPSLSGTLVHLTGKATTQSRRTDEQFNLAVKGLQLERRAEMYQWRESCNKHGCHYEHTWREGVINSRNFSNPAQHRNPEMTVKSRRWTAPDATVGAHRVGPALLGELPTSQTIEPKVVLSAMDGEYRDRAAVIEQDGRRYLCLRYQGHDQRCGTKVGDIRLRWTASPPGTISLYGKLVDTTVKPYQRGEGRSTIGDVSYGTKNAQAMLVQTQDSAQTRLWMIRAVALLGTGLGLLGLFWVVRPLLQSLGASVPTNSLSQTTTAFGLGTVLVLLIIGVMWLASHPLYASMFMASSIGAMVGVHFALQSLGSKTDA